jgi:hypothetical protein
MDLYQRLADKDKEIPDFPKRLKGTEVAGTFRSRKSKGVEGAEKLER